MGSQFPSALETVLLRSPDQLSRGGAFALPLDGPLLNRDRRRKQVEALLLNDDLRFYGIEADAALKNSLMINPCDVDWQFLTAWVVRRCPLALTCTAMEKMQYHLNPPRGEASWPSRRVFIRPKGRILFSATFFHGGELTRNAGTDRDQGPV
jgi:hypothetical protein